MGSRQDDMLVCYQGASADSRLYREERKHRNQTRYYPPINVFLIQYLNIFPSNQRKMKLSDKPISIFHCLSLKKWNANAEPEDQSWSQNQDENQPLGQKEQDQGEGERHEHYNDTYSTPKWGCSSWAGSARTVPSAVAGRTAFGVAEALGSLRIDIYWTL